MLFSVFVIQEDQGVMGCKATKGGRVVLDRLAGQAQRDPQDLSDFLDQAACLEDRDLLVTQVPMVRLEYLVDMLGSTLPSNAFVYSSIYYISFVCLLHLIVKLYYILHEA